MQQEFYYNKRLKNKGIRRHWALSAPNLQDVIPDYALIMKRCPHQPTSEAQGCQRLLSKMTNGKILTSKDLMRDGCKNRLIVGYGPLL